MAIKRGSKVETSFGSASMTDLMFLLLIFLMVATTLINSNALKILLPESSNQISEKPTATISVTVDLEYYLDKVPMSISHIESVLRERFEGVDKPVVMLNIDKRVSIEELTKLMNMAKSNDFVPFLVTKP